MSRKRLRSSGAFIFVFFFSVALAVLILGKLGFFSFDIAPSQGNSITHIQSLEGEINAPPQ